MSITTNAARRHRGAATIAAIISLAVGVPTGSVAAHNADGATADQTNDSWHRWTSNGCGPSGMGGLVPDGAGYFTFNHACDHHDGCYQGYGHRNWVSRRTCDNRLLRDMRSSCANRHGAARWGNVGRAACDRTAAIYHGSVRWLGRWSYGGPINN